MQSFTEMNSKLKPGISSKDRENRIKYQDRFACFISKLLK